MTSLVSAPTLGFSSPLPLPQRKNAWCWTWRLRNLPIRKPCFFLGQDWPRLNEVTQRRRDENGTTANEQATQRKAGPRWTWLEAWPLLWCYKRGLHFKQDLNDIFGSMSFFVGNFKLINLPIFSTSTKAPVKFKDMVTYCKKNKTRVFYFTNNQRVKRSAPAPFFSVRCIFASALEETWCPNLEAAWRHMAATVWSP